MVVLTRDPAPFAEQLPVFGMAEYLSSRSSEYGWYVGGGLAMPFYVDRRFVFRRMVVTSEPVQLRDGQPCAEKRFLDDFVGAVQAEGRVDFIAKPQANVVFSSAPDGCDVVDWGSYVAPLDSDDEGLLARVQPRTRSSIRRAMREGVAVEVTSDVGVVYSLLRDTMVRQRLPFYPSVEFLAACANCRPEVVRFYLSSLGGRPQGCAVVFYNRLGGYYYYGGSVLNPHPGSIPLMHYRIMLDLRNSGVRKYDFMGARVRVEQGSRIEGIQRFKSHMGTTFVRGYSFRCVIRRTRYRLFNAAARLYLRAKGQTYPGDAIDDLRNLKHGVPAPGMVESSGPQ